MPQFVKPPVGLSDPKPLYANTATSGKAVKTMDRLALLKGTLMKAKNKLDKQEYR